MNKETPMDERLAAAAEPIAAIMRKVAQEEVSATVQPLIERIEALEQRLDELMSERNAVETHRDSPPR